MKELDLDAFGAKVEKLVRDAVEYQEQLSPDRIRAMEYYNGDMKDMKPREGWSAAVSRDLRSTISKAVPSIMRTLVGSDKIVEYQPQSENDEESASQATDYVNEYVMQESGAVDAIHDACHDALLLRNGVLHWYVDERILVEGSEHTGLDELSLAFLVADDGVEVLEQREDVGQDGMPIYSVKIKRKRKERNVRLVSVPMDEFLVSSDALSVDDAALVGQWRKVTRSDLVAIGYKKEDIDALPTAEINFSTDAERYTRRKYTNDERREELRENEKIDYYDLYVRIDADGDGIAELRHICLAGGFKGVNILVNDYASDVPYADVVSERNPHQWEGISIADDVIEIQKVKTALLRYALDNIYWQNTRQPIVDPSGIENPEAVMQPEFGRPILLKNGRKPNEVVGWNDVPFVAGPITEFIGYWDSQIVERTGIDDASAGLPPDALQNVTAKASALMEQKGIARVEMIIRTLANGGLKKAFRGILRLIVENQDKARTVRLRDKWVEVDPRAWNAEMDATVNTGLGAGTRERDMAMMQGVMAIQEKLLAAFGPLNNPFVGPDNLWSSLAGLVTASGLKSPTMYFTKPDKEAIAAKAAEAQSKPDPEQIKAEYQKQIEQVKAEAAMMKEKAQAEADIIVKQKTAEIEAMQEQFRTQLEAAKKSEEIGLKRYEIDEKIKLEREKIAIDYQKAQASELARNIASMSAQNMAVE